MTLLAAALALSGCLGGGGGGGSGSGGQAPPPGTNPGTVAPPPTPEPNRAPVISGTPTASILVGESYSFTPTASDPDGDALTFSIAGAPSWATFDPATGRLSGTPGAGDAGTTAGIRISVSDGEATANLSNFDITINQIAMGSATLSWRAPSENADGTPLTDLAGYHIYYGRDRNQLNQQITIDNPGITTYVVENLSPSTWYFSMTSFNSHGVESDRSGTASKTIG